MAIGAGRARTARRRSVAVLVALAMAAAGCRQMLPRQYEYDEEVHVSVDGSATVYVNGSVPALVALRGIDLDPGPRARFDRAAIRAFFSSDAARVTRVSQSRRRGRRFVHVRLEVPDVRRLGESDAFSWASYALEERDGELVYRQTVGAPAGRPVGDVGWNGSELVAFRLHLPSRIRYHDAPSKTVERGNIVVWEQALTERLAGTPVSMEVRMEPQSILYSTLLLFGLMFLLVAATFAVILWLVIRRGRRASEA